MPAMTMFKEICLDISTDMPMNSMRYFHRIRVAMIVMRAFLEALRGSLAADER